MAKKRILEGPIGNGWVEEVKTRDGAVFIARWNAYVKDPDAPDGRRKVRGGSYEIGPKVHHGPKGSLTSKKEATKRWLGMCDSAMGRTRYYHPLQMADKTFEWYTVEMFERSRSTRWRETSKYAFDYYKGKLLAEFGSVPLKAMNDADMQKFLNRLRDEKYSKSVVEHCMKYLKAILEDAVDEDVLGKNPARKLRLPDGLPEEDTPYLPITDYLKLLKELPTKRDQIMAGLLYMGGLRRGELFGLRWQDYDGGTVAVERQINRFYKEADPKTKSSRAKIVIPPALRSDLDGWRQWCPDSSPTAYIFPSKSGSAIHFKNWADRVLKPAAKRAKLERISYHMFRRGLATEAHQSGEVDKNIQAQMRHASPDETRNTYMKHVPDAHKVSMTRLEETVNGKATEAAAKLSQATAPSDTNTDGPKAA